MTGQVGEMSGAPERIETIVIGGGQSGLAVGYYLTRQGRPFVILDANDRIGDTWRKRWDSLRVFTPARLDGLPGIRSPRRLLRFPRRTMWPTTWWPTRLDSIFPFEPGSGWTGSPGLGTGSW